ncbi:Uncharacterised protein [Segatella copri]|nr:Uncharacterised protein [Segatella copri]
MNTSLGNGAIHPVPEGPGLSLVIMSHCRRYQKRRQCHHRISFFLIHNSS